MHCSERTSTLSSIKIPLVSQKQFRDRVNSRVLIRGGKVVNAVNAFEQLSTDHRMTLMFAVKVRLSMRVWGNVMYCAIGRRADAR